MNKKLFILLIVFCLIQIPLLFSTLIGDENVYYYMGKIVSEGETPYVDFFYGHPPIQVYIYAGLIKLFGFHIWVLKLFTLSIIVACSVLVYLISKERYDEKIGIVSVILFLTSYDILIFGSFAFGIEIAVLFFLISWYFLDKKPFLCGLFFGFSLMVRLHLLPLGIILFIYSKKKRLFLMGSGICLVYYGLLLRVPNFVDNVFMYHVGKLNNLNGWLSFLRANLPLFILFIYSFKKIKDTFTIDLAIVYLAFLIILGSVFEYYFLIITIILCIESAYALTYSRFRKMLWVMIIVWTLIMGIKVGVFVYEQTNEYNDFIDYVSTLEGDIMGESSLASLIAMRTGKTIHLNQIDMNFQRRTVYNFTDSLVVYSEKRFNGYLFNCSLIHERYIGETNYRVWSC